PDGGRAHHAAAVVAAAGDGSRAVHLNPGPQHVREPELVGGAQRLDVVDPVRRRVVVVREPGVEGHAGSPGDGFRRNPGKGGDAAFVSHAIIVSLTWPARPAWCPVSPAWLPAMVGVCLPPLALLVAAHWRPVAGLRELIAVGHSAALPERAIGVFLADDNLIVREGVRALIERD